MDDNQKPKMAPPKPPKPPKVVQLMQCSHERHNLAALQDATPNKLGILNFIRTANKERN